MTTAPRSFANEHLSPARANHGRTAAVLPLPVRAADGVPKVELQGISLSYKTDKGTRLLALDNIGLSVKPGEFLCIVGPSGCG